MAIYLKYRRKKGYQKNTVFAILFLKISLVEDLKEVLNREGVILKMSPIRQKQYIL
jgi:hypothetical protein